MRRGGRGESGKKLGICIVLLLYMQRQNIDVAKDQLNGNEHEDLRRKKKGIPLTAWGQQGGN